MFALEQGIVSPRDGSVNWTPYEVYQDLKAAKAEARRFLKKHPQGAWRIVETKVVWHSQIDK